MPHIQLPLDHVRREHNLWALYELFLLKGTDALKASALQLSLPHVREHELFELKLAGRRVKQVTTRTWDRLSLRYLVDILVSVGISANDIAGGAISFAEILR